MKHARRSRTLLASSVIRASTPRWKMPQGSSSGISSLPPRFTTTSECAAAGGVLVQRDRGEGEFLACKRWIWSFLSVGSDRSNGDEGQQKIKIVRTNRQSNLPSSCQSIFSLSWHHPSNKLMFLLFLFFLLLLCVIKVVVMMTQPL